MEVKMKQAKHLLRSVHFNDATERDVCLLSALPRNSPHWVCCAAAVAVVSFRWEIFVDSFSQ
jgi:hypothetical protein